MGILILWLIALGATIPLTIFRGYVIVALWNWFVITQFPGAPHLSIVGAIGLSYFISLFQTVHENSKKDQDNSEALAELFGGLAKNGVITLVTWGFGYVIHCYM